MELVRQEFDKRVSELDEFLTFLKLVEKDRAEIHVPVRVNAYKMSQTAVSDEIKVILKATVFLLLYNLAESTAERSMQHVLSVIDAEQITLFNVAEKVRKIWAREKVDGLHGARIETITDKIDEFLGELACGSCVSFRAEVARKSYQGNLDSNGIREIGRKWGFQVLSRKQSKGGEKLDLVKQKRNDLAHGNYSFTETGRDYLFADLLQMRKEIVPFLEDFMKAVSNYVESERYKVAS